MSILTRLWQGWKYDAANDPFRCDPYRIGRYRIYGKAAESPASGSLRCLLFHSQNHFRISTMIPEKTAHSTATPSVPLIHLVRLSPGVIYGRMSSVPGMTHASV